jgi:hypothetical protein
MCIALTWLLGNFMRREGCVWWRAEAICAGRGRGEIPPLHRPTSSQERTRKKKLACSGRDDTLVFQGERLEIRKKKLACSSRGETLVFQGERLEIGKDVGAGRFEVGLIKSGDGGATE